MINTLSRYIKSNNQHFKRVEYEFPVISKVTTNILKE